MPGAGYIGVFDRSHYEDVLIVRVRELAPPEEIERRYGAINEFEQRLVDGGTTILKCMLHISADEQKERLLARLDDPTKHWKFNPGDIDERALWPAYREAYEIALERTNTEHAPWHVIPADRKWYRNLAIGELLLHDAARAGPAVAGRGLRRRGRAGAAARSRRSRSRDPHRRGHPLRHAAARGRQPARASSRPTTSAPTSASSAAPARGCGCWSPRWSWAGSPSGSGCARRGWWPSTSTRRSPATRPTRRSRTCSTRAPGSTSASTSCPARSASTATCPTDGDERRPRVLWLDAFVANVDRSWRNPNLLLWHGDLWVIDHGASLYFHHGWAGGVGDPARFAAQPWGADDHVFARARGRAAAADAEIAPLLGRGRVRRGARRRPGRVAGAGARGRRTRPRSGRRTSTSSPPGSAPGSGCPRAAA